MRNDELSDKTRAAMDWCQTFSEAAAEFSDRKIHPARLRKLALKLWLSDRTENPIHVAKRVWLEGGLMGLQDENPDSSQMETLPAPLIR